LLLEPVRQAFSSTGKGTVQDARGISGQRIHRRPDDLPQRREGPMTQPGASAARVPCKCRTRTTPAHGPNRLGRNHGAMLTQDLCLLRSVIRAGNQTRWIAEYSLVLRLGCRPRRGTDLPAERVIAGWPQR
jgi:hypothetical protein